MDSSGEIEINEDDEIWQADFEWNMVGKDELDQSIIDSSERLIRNHPVEVKLDNLAIMLNNIRWMYETLKSNYRIEVRSNVGLRDAPKEQEEIRKMLEETYSEDIDSISVSFVKNQKPLKINSTYLIEDLYESLKKIASKKYSSFREPDKNTKNYSSYFTDSCILDIKRFLNKFTNLQREKFEELSNEQARFIADVFSESGMSLEDNKSPTGADLPALA